MPKKADNTNLIIDNTLLVEYVTHSFFNTIYFSNIHHKLVIVYFSRHKRVSLPKYHIFFFYKNKEKKTYYIYSIIEGSKCHFHRKKKTEE